MAKYKSGVLQEEEKPKEPTIKDITEAFIKQFEVNFNEHINAIGLIPEASIPDDLKSILNQLQSDTFHFFDNYWMTQNIINIDENGRPLMKGGRPKTNEYIFIEQINEVYIKEHYKCMPYKIVLKKIKEENVIRNENGEVELREIHENTYTKYKKQIKDKLKSQ